MRALIAKNSKNAERIFLRQDIGGEEVNTIPYASTSSLCN